MTQKYENNTDVMGNVTEHMKLMCKKYEHNVKNIKYIDFHMIFVFFANCLHILEPIGRGQAQKWRRALARGQGPGTLPPFLCRPPAYGLQNVQKMCKKYENHMKIM